MIKSKKSLGIETVVELELDQASNKSYVTEDGVISHNCKWCRKFYQDHDGTPKVYRLSELLSNGSNYGKKPIDWKPTTLATHPFERCSAVIELKPGFKVLAGGAQTFIGYEDWQAYIQGKTAS